MCVVLMVGFMVFVCGGFVVVQDDLNVWIFLFYVVEQENVWVEFVVGNVVWGDIFVILLSLCFEEVFDNLNIMDEFWVWWNENLLVFLFEVVWCFVVMDLECVVEVYFLGWVCFVYDVLCCVDSMFVDVVDMVL